MKKIEPRIAVLLAQARVFRQESLALRPQLQQALVQGAPAHYLALCVRGSELRAQTRALVDQAVAIALERSTLRGFATL
jgi:hypothetical protein